MRTSGVALFVLASGLTACATAPAPQSGYLSRYDGLTARSDTVRATVAQRRDDAAARLITAVVLERAELMPDAAPALTAEDWGLVLGEMDRQICYEMSKRFEVVEQAGAGVGRVRVAATRVSATHPVGSLASAAANWFIPGPIGVRVPGATGGLAAEAEMLDSEGDQVAAIVWARNAMVVGTDTPSLSRVGDAHQLAEAFGDMVAETFAPSDRAIAPVGSPDPCARYGPRNRLEGFVTRAVTGLYAPEVSGGRRASPQDDAETPNPQPIEPYSPLGAPGTIANPGAVSGGRLWVIDPAVPRI